MEELFIFVFPSLKTERNTSQVSDSNDTRTFFADVEISMNIVTGKMACTTQKTRQNGKKWQIDLERGSKLDLAPRRWHLRNVT